MEAGKSQVEALERGEVAFLSPSKKEKKRKEKIGDYYD